MKVRADIAELLRAGVPQMHICRRLRCAPITVQRTREALGLPARKPCRVLPVKIEDAFRQHVRPVDDGHAEWTGPLSDGTPRVTHQGRVRSAYWVAYRIATGREPDGRALPSCGRAQCMQLGHHADRADRAREKRVAALYTAIFGPPA